MARIIRLPTLVASSNRGAKNAAYQHAIPVCTVRDMPLVYILTRCLFKPPPVQVKVAKADTLAPLPRRYAKFDIIRTMYPVVQGCFDGRFE
jgi:hypothetical protein